MKIKSSATSAEVFRLLIAHELKVIEKWQSIAIEGTDTEGVHQLRISLRKIRTVFSIYKPLIDCKPIRTYVKSLKQFSKSLDKARELDVYLTTNFTTQTESPLHALARTQRKQAYKQVKKTLTSEFFNQRLKQIKKSLKSNKWLEALTKKQKQELDSPIPDFAADVLDTLRARILSSHCDAQSQNEDLHELRIDFKRLRYAIEFFKSIYPNDDVRVFIRQVKQLQDCLGVIHDCFVVKTLHKTIISTQNPNPVVLEEMFAIENRLDAQAQALRAEMSDQYLLFCFHPAPWKIYSRHTQKDVI